MSIKLTVVAKRYNSEKLIRILMPWGSNISYGRRWQVSFKDDRGRYYDHSFVAKSTRKQIRKLIRGINK